MATAGTVVLSRRLQRGAASLRQVEDAFRAGLAVEGKVAGVVKGGFEVTVARQRAFCPFSQIDTNRSTDPNDHVGRVYAFRIIEFKEGGRNLVVSRRALLQEAQQADAATLRQSIVPGAVMKGPVASVRDFGAFVDLGAGVQGLVHVSEMGWARVSDPAKLLTPGQELEVKVLRVEQDGEKIALGIKQLTADPWTTIGESYAVGQVHVGRVTRHAEFGVFVELEPGVEGLAHASTFPPTGGARAWTRALPVGSSAPFEILSIERGQEADRHRPRQGRRDAQRRGGGRARLRGAGVHRQRRRHRVARGQASRRARDEALAPALLRPQGVHRIHTDCPTGGNVGGREGHASDDERHGAERRRVERTDREE